MSCVHVHVLTKIAVTVLYDLPHLISLQLWPADVQTKDVKKTLKEIVSQVPRFPRLLARASILFSFQPDIQQRTQLVIWKTVTPDTCKMNNWYNNSMKGLPIKLLEKDDTSMSLRKMEAQTAVWEGLTISKSLQIYALFVVKADCWLVLMCRHWVSKVIPVTGHCLALARHSLHYWRHCNSQMIGALNRKSNKCHVSSCSGCLYTHAVCRQETKKIGGKCIHMTEKNIGTIEGKEPTDRWTNRQANRQRDRWTSIQTDRWTSRQEYKNCIYPKTTFISSPNERLKRIP